MFDFFSLSLRNITFLRFFVFVEPVCCAIENIFYFNSFCICPLCKFQKNSVVMQTFLLYSCLPDFLYANLFFWLWKLSFLFVWFVNYSGLWTVCPCPFKHWILVLWLFRLNSQNNKFICFLVLEELNRLRPLSALGYFQVNKSTFLSILTNSVAYLVILIQFISPDDSSHLNNVNGTQIT